MIDGIRELGRAALVEGLAEHLDEVAWGSQDLSAIVNLYVIRLCKNAGSAILVRLSPFLDLGLEVPDAAVSAAQLAALQGMPTEEFSKLIEDAWKKANDEDPPEGVGYKHFGGEVAMEAIRRLKPRS